jgi:4-hydroxyproline epimerase
MISAPRSIRIVDSHTGGEPTRVVVEGGPDFGQISVASQLAELRRSHDELRRICIHEPRGGEVWVGALICRPHDPSCDFGVIFFNNVGYLGMCGHGTIGLVATLAYLNQVQSPEPGNDQGNDHGVPVRIETPVGVVEAVWYGNGKASITNVASRRIAKDVVIDVPDVGRVRGDVAWSGNGFFLVKDSGLRIAQDNIPRLLEVAKKIRLAINDAGFTEVDHVELFGPATVAGADSKNFVLCPGGAFDRSPCGTGTSAKLACLAADGLLNEGATWVQESIIGTTFQGTYRWQDRQSGEIIPTITGTAFVTAKAELIVDPDDPFPTGLGDIPGTLA